jgi:hypothetical protein
MKSIVKKLSNSPHRRYLLFFIMVFGLYHIPNIVSGLIEPILVSKIQSSAESAGFELSIHHASYSLPLSLFADTVVIRDIKSGTLPPVSLESFSFVLKKVIPPFAAEINLHGYQGSTQCTIATESRYPALPYRYSCILSSLSLESHPLLFALGTKGHISGSIDGVMHQNPDLNNATFSLTIQNGSIDPEKVLLSSIIKVPAFDSIDVEIQGSLSGREILISEGFMLTTYGKVTSITGNVLLRDGILSDYKARGTLQLNQDGVKTIAPWLSLLAPDHNFTTLSSNFNVTSIQGQPKVLFGN